MQKKIKLLIGILLTLSIIFVGIGFTDYWVVHHEFQKPIFARLDVDTAYKDGGSGTYHGLGYSFEIEGYFMPEDEFPGVTSFKYYLLGNFIGSGIRD